MHRNMGLVNEDRDCILHITCRVWMEVYSMHANSSTELTHESATNISTQEIGVLCHNDCMYNN